MGYFALTVKRDDVDPVEIRVAISDADNARFAAAYAASYFPNGVEVSPAVAEVPEVPAVLDENGNVVTPGTPAVPAQAAVYRAPTGTEIIEKIAQGLAAGMMANVISFEKAQAAAAAVANIPEISVSPVS